MVREEVFENLSLYPGHERYFVRVINGDPEEPDYVERLSNGTSILVHVEDCARIQGRLEHVPSALQRKPSRAAMMGGHKHLDGALLHRLRGRDLLSSGPF